MENIQQIAEVRLKNALNASKHFNSERFSSILKAEIYDILKNYTELKQEDFKIEIIINDDGEYILKMTAKIRKLKPVWILPNSDIL